jgi:hypothetical protein
MTDRELMQQALDALENSVDLVREDAYNAEKLYGKYPTRQGQVGGLKVLADDHEKAITALRDRLAQPEQEPVAWMYVNVHNECEEIGYGKTYFSGHEGCTPLYSNPPQRPWVGLTDNEFDSINPKLSLFQFYKAIEAKLKEKNK